MEGEERTRDIIPANVEVSDSGTGSTSVTGSAATGGGAGSGFTGAGFSTGGSGAAVITARGLTGGMPSTAKRATSARASDPESRVRRAIADSKVVLGRLVIELDSQLTGAARVSRR